MTNASLAVHLRHRRQRCGPIEEWRFAMSMDEHYRNLMRVCYSQARHSPDRSTQNYAIIVGEDGELIGRGCNTFLPGVDPNDAANHERPRKYEVTEHAERSAIFAAAIEGKSTRGATMVCNWAACHDCARAIRLAGIKRLVTHADSLSRSPDRWREPVERALAMLRESGVEVVLLEGPVNAGVKVRFDGGLIDV